MVCTHSFPLSEFLSVLERSDSRTVLSELCEVRGASYGPYIESHIPASKIVISTRTVGFQNNSVGVKRMELHDGLSHRFPLPKSLSVLERSTSRTNLKQY